MTAAELAAAFEARRASRTDLEALVKDNMAELAKSGLPAADADEAECVGLVRTIARGCAATAFALAAACADEGRADGRLCDAAAYLGLAEHAYRLAIQTVTDRPGAARLPGPQFGVARIRGELDTMTALVYASLHDPEDRGDVVTSPEVARYYLAASAEQVVSTAVDLVGGADQRVGNLWHDLMQGPVLPFDRYLALEVIGKTSLGIDPAETPRWL